MALRASGGGTLLPSFQARFLEALKAEGLIPMSTGVTRPVRSAGFYGEVIRTASTEVARAGTMFGPRAGERYSTQIGNSYRDKRFAMIASLESVKLRAYQDTKHNVSVGLGFNMDKSGARDVWTQAFGNTVSFDDVKSGRKAITSAQAKTLFDHDITYYEKVVTTAAGNRPLTENQRLSLVSIAYSTPKRVSSWAPVIQAGDDKKLQELILTQSFAPNHPQADGLKARRFVEASVFSGSGELQSLMPSFDQYMAAVEIDQPTGRAKVVGAWVSDDELEPGRTSELSYANSGATRRLKVTGDLEREIRKSVTSVYGADYKVSVISGGQDGTTGKTGSRRHDTMTAADVYVYDPSGKRLTAEQMKPLAQDWIARDIGSVGLPTNGSTQSMHLDLIGGTVTGSTPLGNREGRFWFYGGEDAAMRKTLTAKAAPSYTLSPSAVAMGYVPPASIPSVGSELSIPTNPVPSSVEAKLIARSRAAPVKEPVQGLRLPFAPGTVPVPKRHTEALKARTKAEVNAALDAHSIPLDATFSKQNPTAAVGLPTITSTGALAPADALKAIREVPVGSYQQPIRPTSMAGKTPFGTPIAGNGTLNVPAAKAVQTVVPVRPIAQMSSAGPVAAPTTKYGVTATGYVGDYGASPGQSTAGLKPGDRTYNHDTNSWERK